MSQESKITYCRFKCDTQVYYDTANHKYFPTEIITKKVHNYTRCADALRAKGKEIPGFFKDKILRETTHVDVPESYKKFPFYCYLRVNAYGKTEIYLKGHWLEVGFFEKKDNVTKFSNDLVIQTQKLKEIENNTENANKIMNFNNSLDKFF